MAQAKAQEIRLAKQGNTKRFCRYNVVTEGFTGSLYTPQDDTNPDTLTLVVKGA